MWCPLEISQTPVAFSDLEVGAIYVPTNNKTLIPRFKISESRGAAMDDDESILVPKPFGLSHSVFMRPDTLVYPCTLHWIPS